MIGVRYPPVIRCQRTMLDSAGFGGASGGKIICFIVSKGSDSRLTKKKGVGGDINSGSLRVFFQAYTKFTVSQV